MQQVIAPLSGAAALVLALFLGGADPAQAQVRGKVIHAVYAPNLCVDVSRGNPASGTKVQLWTCSGDFPQRFTFDAARGIIRMAAYPNSCIEQEQGGGSMMEVIECRHAWNRWHYDPTSVRFFTGQNRCLSWGRQYARGTWLEARPCSMDNNVKFMMTDR